MQKKFSPLRSLTFLYCIGALCGSCNKDLNQQPLLSNTSAVQYSTPAGYKQVLAKVYGSYELTSSSGTGSSDVNVAGISDPAHYAYPTYAKATRSRHDKLVASANDLREKLEEAKAELQDAFEDMKKVEILDDREKASERAEIAAREQAEMDRIGSRMRMASRG